MKTIAYLIAALIACVSQQIKAQVIEVTSPTQLANSIAPQGSQTSFTKVTLTANGIVNQVVNSVTVERQGSGSDSAFTGVILLDESGAPVGKTKALNSNHQASIGEPIVLRPGIPRTFTVAGQMSDSLTNNVGEISWLAIVGINTDTTVIGSLPIIGANHTMNTSLKIGHLTITTDPNRVSQDIIPNAPSQPLGGFFLDVGNVEHVAIRSPAFQTYVMGASTGSITGVVLMDDQGVVVAGPIDIPLTMGFASFQFNDNIIVQKSAGYTLRGKLPATVASGTKLLITTTPSDWIASGLTYGFGIIPKPAGGVVASVPMTVRGSALSIGTTPGSGLQVLVPGTFNADFISIDLDATSSGEDIRLSSLSLSLSLSDGAMASNLTNCRLFDGAFAINTGANTLGTASAGQNTITFDQALTVSKGTKKTLILKGHTYIGTTGVYTWSLTPQINVVGIISSQAVQPTAGSSTNSSTVMYGSTGGNINIQSFAAEFNGQSIRYNVRGTPGYSFSVYTSSDLINWSQRTVLTVPQNGSIDLGDYLTTVTNLFYKAQAFWPSRLTVRTDPPGSGPIVTGGSTNVTIGNYVFHAAFEGVRIHQFPIKLTSGSPSDLVRATFWNRDVQIGSAVFVGAQTNSVVSLATPLVIQGGLWREMTVKLDLAEIGVGQTGTSGSHVRVDIDTARSDIWSANGISSGTSIIPTGSTSVAGVRIYKSLPICEIVPHSASGIADGVLCRVKITANAAGDISLAKLSFFLQGTSVSVSDVSLYGYEDATFSQPIGSFSTLGGKVAVAADTNTLIFAADSSSSVGGEKFSGRWLEMFIQNPSGSPDIITIPAGQSRYFVVRGTPQGVTGTSVLATTMKFDSPATGMSAVYPLYPDRSFIWSPNTFGIPDLNTSTDWSGSPGELLTPTIHQVRIP